jgi:cyclopropane fatty-acyl-phospholipid synthase-like methyltransferase
MKRKPIKPLLRAAYRTLYGLHLRSYETYQPVIGNKGTTEGTRECGTRWQAIDSLLTEHDCHSLVDLGCSEGYYVLQAARRGLEVCVGVDFDLRRMWTCQSQVVLNDLHHASFLMSEVTPELVTALPRFDAVIFLSVLHHIMYEKSPEYAREIITGLAKKTNKVMIFEMGQSDEHLESWAKKIPDMGSDPHAWIAEYLRSAGFSHVEKIGEASSYMQEVNRAMFKAIP